MKISKARAIANKKINDAYQDQYHLPRDYCEELLRSNHGGTVKIDVEPKF